MKTCLLLLLCLDMAAGDCSWSDLIGAKTRSISAGGSFSVWASSHWVDTVKVMVSSDDDSVLTVKTQESRDSSYYKSAASALNTVCFSMGSSTTVRSEPGSLYVIIECENWWNDCPIHYDIDFSCVDCSANVQPTTSTTTPSPLASCSVTDVASAESTGTISPRGYKTVWSTSAWVTSVRIMVSSDDGSSLDVKTKLSRDASTYKSAASELNTGCFKTGSFVKLRSDPGQIYVIIECDNYLSDCPIHYDVDYLCEDCATTEAPAAASGCSDYCWCNDCSEALACEQAKCDTGETFQSSGCSSSVTQINGVTSSTAYQSGVCRAPSPSTSSSSSSSWSVASAPVSNDCTDSCICSSCTSAFSCEQAKCMADETFLSFGCSSSVEIYNGIATSTASYTGNCLSDREMASHAVAAASLLTTAALLVCSM